jgi:hypothetical protein
MGTDILCSLLCHAEVPFVCTHTPSTLTVKARENTSAHFYGQVLNIYDCTVLISVHS